MVPFTMGVSMQPGLMIYVNGTPTGGRFSINLRTGPGANADYAFHFNPRFDQGNVIVRNTCTNGQWGQEERQLGFFPFAIGQHFEAIVLCQQNQFKVAINGRHLLEYRHRLPLQSASYLTVQGDVTLSMVRTDLEYPKPNTKPAAPKIINNPNIPISAVVPFGNMKGHKVIVTGVPLAQTHDNRIEINLKAEPPNNHIYFHFNPRFNESQIVRNSLLDNGWGAEERNLSIPFPFQYGVPYQVTIHVEQGFMRVNLNGMDIFNYAHRKRPLTLIRQVDVKGATAVSRIAFE